MSPILWTADYTLLYYALTLATIWLLRKYLGQCNAYSVMRNIPGPPSGSWVKGNIMQFYDRRGQAFQEGVALNYGAIVRLEGLFGSKMLYVSDPKALHAILVKEEDTFEEPESVIVLNQMIFGDCLTAKLGDHHRRQRKMLNPVFSVNHMRHMLPIFYSVVLKLREVMLARVKSGETDIDVLEWSGRTALELIGQGGLGYSFDPLLARSESRSDYGDALRSLVPSLSKIAVMQSYLHYLNRMGPGSFRRFVVNKLPSPHIQNIKNVVDIMSARSYEIFNQKKDSLKDGDEAVVRQVGEGKDIMSILMKANMSASEGDRLPESELIAQMSLLVFAATDTTSNTLARILHLLAEHKDIQTRLRDEVLQSGAASGDISYDELNKLPLLDAVCRETLRLYPPVTILRRVTRKDSIIPLSEPVWGLDGTKLKEIPVPRGTQIIIGVLGANARKELWGEDSLEWRPERWISPLPRRVTEAGIPGVYSNLMTFLGGKRACIGFKFSEMEMKVALAVMLSAFAFEQTDKEIAWNVAGVTYPTVDGDGDQPRLPLRVKLHG